MKFSFQAVALFLVVMLTGFTAVGADYYIMYNPSCMDRLEYAYGFTPSDQYYVKYHLKVTPTEVVVFEVGPENNSPTQNYLNARTITCGDQLDRTLVEKVRNPGDNVYIIRQVNNKYQISRVNNASFFRRDARGVYYDSWQFSFQHSGGLKPGDVLTNDPAKMIKVTYEGITPYECSDAYRFRMEFQNHSSYRDLFFIPNLGIVEEQPNSGSSKDIYKLKNFNGTPFSTYLQRLCSSNSGALLSKNFLPINPSESYTAAKSPAAAPTNSAAVNTAPPAKIEFHVVERGETLYAISRRYHVPVKQLRTWNDLEGSSLIKIGDKIRVAPPGASATGRNASSYASVDRPVADPFSGAPATNNTPRPSAGTTAFPTSPTKSPTRMTVKGGDPRFAWNTTNGTHLVKSGETVALLALRYGYTEARFRDMNNLGPNDILKVGQTLRTTDCPTETSTPKSGYEQLNDAINRYNNAKNPNYDFENNQPKQNSNNQNNWTPRSTEPAPSQGTPSSSSFEPYQSGGPELNSYREMNSGSSENSNNIQRYNNPYGNQPAETKAPPQNQPANTFGTPIPAGKPTANSSSSSRGNSFYSGSGHYVPAGSTNTNNKRYETAGPGSTQIIHIVREGDTIESIARKYNTTADHLRQVNNLEKTEVLIPYQKLSIN